MNKDTKMMNKNGFTGLFCLIFLALVSITVVVVIIVRRSGYDPGPPPPPETGPSHPENSLPTATASNQDTPGSVGTDKENKQQKPPKPEPAAYTGPTTKVQFLRKLAETKAIPNIKARREAMKDLGRELALEDFDNAMRLMKALSDYLNKLYICQGVFETKGTLDPQEAIRQAKALDPGPRTGGSSIKHARNTRVYMEAIRSAVHGWASADPEAAAEYLATMPEAIAKSTASGLYGTWAKSDPQGALRSVGGLSEEMQSLVLPNIYRNWVVYDAKEAWTHVFNLSASELPSRSGVLATIALAWAEEDLNGAVEWINQTVTDDSEYSAMLSNMARGLLSSNPEKAARMYASIPGLHESNPDLLNGTLRKWVNSAPEAAAQWSLEVDLEGVRPTAIKGVASHWAQKDPKAARAWALGLSDEMDKAYALSNVAAQQGIKSPKDSTDWIMQIPDAFTQHRTIAGYVMGRLKRSRNTLHAKALQQMIMTDVIDMNVVDEQIRSSSMNDDEKQVLLDMLP